MRERGGRRREAPRCVWDEAHASLTGHAAGGLSRNDGKLACRLLELRKQAELGIGAFGKVLKGPLAHGLEEVAGLEAADDCGSILWKALENRIELLLAGIACGLILEFGNQHDIPVVLIGSLLGNAMVGEHNAVMLGLLADAHPVVVQITHRGTEHAWLDFYIFEGPNGLLSWLLVILPEAGFSWFVGRTLRGATAPDQS